MSCDSLREKYGETDGEGASQEELDFWNKNCDTGEKISFLFFPKSICITKAHFIS